ncbi:2-iminobutanoate/2-iminopropanoate deaminase [Clostridium tetanomorphum]|uniref:RidA family protein n=1 Tax=Clostridium tetanomorphum TaxID=1553 RepID=A0A923EA00_CLOTT|nr:RidA family protein [Clostridium tetanomorphum]KAJ50311.1 endoribonuclease L-PSP [Clostridium tetanomorphum DSM 665]MBC2397972.1 RidA family protein [Clostridium tetanomorphum]MBP1864522.1 2-iminobutanoate/2-iminopropanoate deaminase [Clostridium tetanomorphum]NRS82946.1 2-iminobutanoate/2-iminopropanoate deaminase [Clostridium tetanomorphum]NRZ98957.1 2-iminobutanoate/2-iminopropanoate deaminase [Clostridium tetanomorphum]
MKKEIINCSKAAPARGPYSHAVRVGNLIFLSGRTPSDLNTGELVDDNIENATRIALENVKAILEEAGVSLENVVKTTVFLRDINDFSIMNKVYGEYFNNNPPARSCVQVSKLPRNAMIEIEAIAVVD